MKWILPVVLGIALVLLVSGCTQTGEIIDSSKCPESCDDNNLCTSDFCSSVTNYECKHQKIEPCCGNDVCEINEDNINCHDDCPKPTYYCPNGLTCPEMENIVSCVPSTITSVNGNQTDYFTLHIDITRDGEDCLLYYEVLDVKGSVSDYFEIGENMNCEIPLSVLEIIYNTPQQMFAFCEGSLEKSFGILFVGVEQQAEEQMQKMRACLDARVLLQRGTYNSETKQLRLTVYNYGKVPLNFEVLLRYPQTSVIYGEEFMVDAGEIEVIQIENMDDDLYDVTVKSTSCSPPCIECPAAQDFIRKIDIQLLRTEEFELICTWNCDRGLELDESEVDYSNLMIKYKLRNTNPNCDMWCSVWRNDEAVEIIESFSGRFENVNTVYRGDEFKLVCAETRSPGCDHTIKQIFELKQIETI